jgi:hypothetical protein
VTTTIVRVGLVVAIGLVVAAPIFVRIVRRRFDPFEPIVLFSLAYGVMFVARPASMIAGHHFVYYGPRTSTDISATFTRVLVLALIGAIAFVVGYELSLGRRVASRWRGLADLTARPVVGTALVTGAIGAIGVIAFFSSVESSSGHSGLSLVLRGRSSELSQEVAGASFYLWYSFLLLVPAILILLAVWLEERRKAFLVAALGLGGLFLLRAVPLGARFAILPLLGGIFVLYYVRRATRPSSLALIVIALVALVGSSFMSDLRGRATRGENLSQTIIRSIHPARIASPFLSGPDSEMAPVLAAALTVIPQKLPHTYGRTIFGDLISRPIPRALWSGKPLPPREKLVSTLWPRGPGQGGINPEFSVLLYLFWDFGIFGIAAGMLLFGIAARSLFEYFLSHRRSSAAQVLYSLSIWFIVIGLRDGPVDTFVQLMFIVFPIWLGLRISARQAMPSHAAVSR